MDLPDPPIIYSFFTDKRWELCASPMTEFSTDTSGTKLFYKELLDAYEQLDGTPCGDLVKP